MLNRSNTRKKLSIPSAMVGLTFGLIATVFVYLFVPPPSTASAASCLSEQAMRKIVSSNCVSEHELKKHTKLIVNNGVYGVIERRVPIGTINRLTTYNLVNPWMVNISSI